MKNYLNTSAVFDGTKSSFGLGKACSTASVLPKLYENVVVSYSQFTVMATLTFSVLRSSFNLHSIVAALKSELLGMSGLSRIALNCVWKIVN